mmetsp:Transcript_4322/g.27522  ORF Transcript_4322/g.27522 Transcript_4322/m.27522 type:complete len:88 (-) Transcript_4322:1446-1709(-)
MRNRRGPGPHLHHLLLAHGHLSTTKTVVGLSNGAGHHNRTQIPSSVSEKDSNDIDCGGEHQPKCGETLRCTQLVYVHEELTTRTSAS